jgi:hypothetical protein
MADVDVNSLSALLASAKVDLDEALQALQGAAAARGAAVAAAAGTTNSRCNTGCACRALQAANPQQ